jgi:hypothetical protein
MKNISLIIDKDFLKQKHIDHNNKWVGEEDQDKQYWVAESTDKFVIEEVYFDRETGDFTFSVHTEGCFVSIEVSLITWIDAVSKSNLPHLIEKWIEKAEAVRKELSLLEKSE